MITLLIVLADISLSLLCMVCNSPPTAVLASIAAVITGLRMYVRRKTAVRESYIAVHFGSGYSGLLLWWL